MLLKCLILVRITWSVGLGDYLYFNFTLLFIKSQRNSEKVLKSLLKLPKQFVESFSDKTQNEKSHFYPFYTIIGTLILLRFFFTKATFSMGMQKKKSDAGIHTFFSKVSTVKPMTPMINALSMCLMDIFCNCSHL